MFTDIPLTNSTNNILHYIYTLPSHIQKKNMCTHKILFMITIAKFIQAWHCHGDFSWANYYMSHHENMVLKNLVKFRIYTRYIDDILTTVNNLRKKNLKDVFKNNFLPHQTSKFNIKNKILFLDIIFNFDSHVFTTSRY